MKAQRSLDAGAFAKPRHASVKFQLPNLNGRSQP